MHVLFRVFVPGVLILSVCVGLLFLTALYHAERPEMVKFDLSVIAFLSGLIAVGGRRNRVESGLIPVRKTVNSGHLCCHVRLKSAKNQRVLYCENRQVRKLLPEKIKPSRATQITKFRQRCDRVKIGITTCYPTCFQEENVSFKNTNQSTGGSVVFHHLNSSLYKKKHQDVQSKTDRVTTGANALRLITNG